MEDIGLATAASMVGGAFVQVIIIAGLFVWGRWVARRQSGPWWRRASWMPLIGLCVEVAGVGLASIVLVRAFGALGSLEPAQRAEFLSGEISHAMLATAITVSLSWALYLASLVAFAVGSIRKPASERGSHQAEPHAG